MTCRPPAPSPVVDPLLIVEVLSPSSRRTDLVDKLRQHKSLPSVQEVWLIGSERLNSDAVQRVEVWQRDRAPWIVQDYVGSASFESAVLSALAPSGKLYRNVVV